MTHPSGVRRGVALGLALSATAVAAEPARTLESFVAPSSGVQSVAFDVGTGSVVLRPSPDARVHARVELEVEAIDFKVARWVSSSDAALVAAARLTTALDAGVLSLRVEYPAPAGDRVHERWEVEVPTPLAAAVHVNVGDADVRGLPAGVSVDVNVGDVRLSLGAGAARAHTNVGQLTAEVDGQPFAHAVLDSNLGEVSAELGGRTLPGELALPPSARLVLDGAGSVDYELSANVGSVRLTVRTP